ncbi:MAG: RNA pseudouridine synthase, partial [Sphaerochaetaceae bacterium]|nr:RNA pseudouridine synthase [Sphaerochaetaceae bacterium]
MTDLSFIENRILYEDNHIIIVNKLPGEIVQGDKTGDITLAEDIKDYLKQKYNKPGNVYLGLPHRLDRPTSGAVMYAKTDKALTRLNDMFREGKVEKHYWAITDNPVTVAGGTIKEGELHHWLFRDSTKNKSFAYVYKEQQGPPKKGCQEARLLFKEISRV